MQVAKPDWIS